MKNAKDILSKLAAGQDAAGINGAMFSADLRSVFAIAVRAIEFRLTVVRALNDTGAPPTLAQAPDSAHQASAQQARRSPTAPAQAGPAHTRAGAPSSAPARAPRWTEIEDADLVRRFTEEQRGVADIAKLHDRSPYAIALRLMNQHKLMTQAEVDAIKAGTRPSAPPPAPAAEPVPAESGQQAMESGAGVDETELQAEAPEVSPAPSEQEPLTVLAESDVFQAQTPAFEEVDASGHGDTVEKLQDTEVTLTSGFEVDASGVLEPVQPVKQADAAIPVNDDGPDWETLLEMEIEMASDEARTFANTLLKRLADSPQLATDLLTYVHGKRSKEKMPEPLRNAIAAKVKNMIARNPSLAAPAA